MHTLAAAGAAFLLAVLWFDLMFDVQTATHPGERLPPEVLASISSYYRRILIEARPMSRVVGLVMLLMLGAIAAEIMRHEGRAWVAIVSLVCGASPIALAVLSTVRNAVALGRREGDTLSQTRLARGLFRDHLYALVAITAVLTLQLANP